MLLEEISTTYLEEKRKATTKTNYKIVSMTLKRSPPSAMTYLAEKHHLLYQMQTPKQELADRLSTYFRTKIEKIWDKINITVNKLKEDGIQEPKEKIVQCDNQLEQFNSISLTKVEDLIRKSTNKSCELDPNPTSILKTVYQRNCTTHWAHHQHVIWHWSISRKTKNRTY